MNTYDPHIYCVQTPQVANTPPESYLGCYEWVADRDAALSTARQKARELEECEIWGDREVLVHQVEPSTGRPNLVGMLNKSCDPASWPISRVILTVPIKEA